MSYYPRPWAEIAWYMTQAVSLWTRSFIFRDAWNRTQNSLYRELYLRLDSEACAMHGSAMELAHNVQ